MADPAGPAAPSRYFLALLPDVAARVRLANLARDATVRTVLPEDLHLTLAFLGALRAPTAAALMTALGPACRCGGALTVALDHIEAWRGPRALCAVGDLPGAAALAAALWDRLEGLGYVRDARPFRAHVTLARNLPAAACAGPPVRIEPPVCWTSRELVLLASGPAAGAPGRTRYVVQAVRPLG
jgi:2'-5' RNA ligase